MKVHVLFDCRMETSRWALFSQALWMTWAVRVSLRYACVRTRKYVEVNKVDCCINHRITALSWCSHRYWGSDCCYVNKKFLPVHVVNMTFAWQCTCTGTCMLRDEANFVHVHVYLAFDIMCSSYTCTLTSSEFVQWWLSRDDQHEPLPATSTASSPSNQFLSLLLYLHRVTVTAGLDGSCWQQCTCDICGRCGCTITTLSRTQQGVCFTITWRKRMDLSE